MNCQCGQILGPRNKSGHCRSCIGRVRLAAIAADPVKLANRSAGIAKAAAKRRPQIVAHFARVRDNMSAEEKAKRRAWGKTLSARMQKDPDFAAKQKAGAIRYGRERSEQAIAWCPPEYRDLYARLKRKHVRGNIRMGAPAARAEIERMIQAELDNMTPFERAMERVRNGAPIYEYGPIRRQVEPMFTLGGVGSALL